jgi:hypothetical protein
VAQRRPIRRSIRGHAPLLLASDVVEQTGVADGDLLANDYHALPLGSALGPAITLNG